MSEKSFVRSTLEDHTCITTRDVVPSPLFDQPCAFVGCSRGTPAPFWETYSIETGRRTRYRRAWERMTFNGKTVEYLVWQDASPYA